MILAGAAAVGVLIAILLANAGERDEAPAGVTNPTLGKGPLLITLFEDYQCSHCRDYSLGPSFEHLYDTWVATNKVELLWRHVAFVGSHSMDAAVQSHCVYALAPASWLEFDHAIYALQADGNEPTRAALRAAATDLGVDGTDLDACMEDSDDRSFLIKANMIELSMSGASGTPALLVGDQTFNPEDTEAVDAAIREALEALGEA